MCLFSHLQLVFSVGFSIFPCQPVTFSQLPQPRHRALKLFHWCHQHKNEQIKVLENKPTLARSRISSLCQEYWVKATLLLLPEKVVLILFSSFRE